MRRHRSPHKGGRARDCRRCGAGREGWRMPLKTVRRFLVALLATLLTLTVVSQAPAMALPDAPSGLTPDGDDVTNNPLLHWNTVDGATSYKLQVSVSPTFSPTIYNVTTVNTNFAPYNAIPTGTAHWRAPA